MPVTKEGNELLAKPCMAGAQCLWTDNESQESERNELMLQRACEA